MMHHEATGGNPTVQGAMRSTDARGTLKAIGFGLGVRIASQASDFQHAPSKSHDPPQSVAVPAPATATVRTTRCARATRTTVPQLGARLNVAY